MTDIKQLKAELAQAKKDLKAAEKRAALDSKHIMKLVDALSECEDSFSYIEASLEDLHGYVPDGIIRLISKDIKRTLKTVSRVFTLKTIFNVWFKRTLKPV